MSKIVCDFCGTSYPETATQCPICGCVRPGNIGAVSTSASNDQPNNGYNYVKGGRFSKSNVKKRNQGKVYAPEDSIEHIRQGGGSNKGLIVAIILLFVAVVAVGVYIAVSLFSNGTEEPGLQTPGGAIFTAATETHNGTEGTDDSQSGGETNPSVVPCQSLNISRVPQAFDKENAAFLLDVEIYPENTTEVIEFSTSDEDVATVDEFGLITAKGYGEAVITIKCGDVETTVTVVCTFGEELPTEPTEPEEEKPVLKPEDFNREEFTMSSKRETWRVYTGEVPVSEITWSSDNEKVAVIENGVVSPTGKGWTYVRAKYGDVELVCKVICAESIGEYEPPVEQQPEEEPEPEFRISHTDVTVKIGETFVLSLLDKDNNSLPVTWTPENPDICTVAGNNVKGVASGKTIVYVEYDGVKYACIVRVP